MKNWKLFRVKELLVVGFAVVTGIGIVVGTVYAASYTFDVGGNVDLWGYDENVIIIDIDGGRNVSGQASYFGMQNKAGLFSGTGEMVDNDYHLWKDRAEVAVGRMTTVGGEAANAWIQSSGGAKVLAQYDGDIIVTLGN